MAIFFPFRLPEEAPLRMFNSSRYFATVRRARRMPLPLEEVRQPLVAHGAAGVLSFHQDLTRSFTFMEDTAPPSMVPMPVAAELYRTLRGVCMYLLETTWLMAHSWTPTLSATSLRMRGFMKEGVFVQEIPLEFYDLFGHLEDGLAMPLMLLRNHMVERTLSRR